MTCPVTVCTAVLPILGTAAELDCSSCTAGTLPSAVIVTDLHC